MELDFSNEMIEKLLLKKAFNDKKWMNILSNVYDERWFKVKNLGLLLKLSVKYFSKYNSMVNIKVLATMAKAYSEKHPQDEISMTEVNELLNEVSNLDLNINEDALNANLKEFIRRNAFYNALWDNSSLLEKDPSAYDKVVDKCLENFDRVQKITFNDTDLGLDYFDEQSMANHWEYIKNPEAKISTGWNALDSYTHGGFLKEGRSLYLFMAQAGLGKSVFLSNIAVNFLKQNLSVVIISLEMSEDVYAQRFDAHISKKNINNLADEEETAISRIKDFYKKYPKANLYIKEYPPKSVTSNDIQVYLENLKNNSHSFDVVIIDYLNLVKSQTKSDNMFADGLDVSEKLRALSYIFKCPVISAVQTNSEGMNNEKLGMENISQSRGIAFTADFLMALYQTDTDRDNGIIEARLLKNRLGGMVGKVMQFAIDPDTLVVADKTFDVGNNLDSMNDDSINIQDLNDDLKKVESDILQL